MVRGTRLLVLALENLVLQKAMQSLLVHIAAQTLLGRLQVECPYRLTHLVANPRAHAFLEFNGLSRSLPGSKDPRT